MFIRTYKYNIIVISFIIFIIIHNGKITVHLRLEQVKIIGIGGASSWESFPPNSSSW